MTWNETEHPRDDSCALAFCQRKRAKIHLTQTKTLAEGLPFPSSLCFRSAAGGADFLRFASVFVLILYAIF